MLKGEEAALIAAFEESDFIDVDVNNATIKLSDNLKSQLKKDKESFATGLLAVGGGSCLWAKRQDAFDALDSRKESKESVEMHELFLKSKETNTGENPGRHSTISNGLEVLQF